MPEHGQTKRMDCRRCPRPTTHAFLENVTDYGICKRIVKGWECSKCGEFIKVLDRRERRRPVRPEPEPQRRQAKPQIERPSRPVLVYSQRKAAG